MDNLKPDDLSPEVYALYDQYVHGQLDRRAFLDKVSRYAVGGLTAVAILNYLSPQYATAQQVRAGDPRRRRLG